MNYLFLIGLLVFSSSCTDYSPIGKKDSDKKPESYFLELDFHQESLAYEDEKLRIEMVSIMEAIEAGNYEGQGRLEPIQERRSTIQQNVEWNTDVFGRAPGIPPGGAPPRCMPDPDPGVMRPCPMPRLALNNLWLTREQWQHTLEEKGSIEVFNEAGEIIGRMEGVSEVPGVDGFYLKAEIEFDFESAHEVRITNLDAREKLRTTSYLLE